MYVYVYVYVCVCVCVLSYSDGLLVVGQHAALSLQVSLLLPPGQLQPAALLLRLLHKAELLVHRPLPLGQTQVSVNPSHQSHKALHNRGITFQ